LPMPENKELTEMLARLSQMRSEMKQRSSDLSSSDNIFLSREDCCLMNNDLQQLYRLIDELEIRISGGLLI